MRTEELEELAGQERVVLHSSRLKWSLIALGCLCGVSICALFLVGGRSDWQLYAGVLFFGAGLLVAGWLLARPGTLILDPGGFRFSGLRPGPFVRWSSVERFKVGTPAAFSKMVYYDYKPEERPYLAAVSRRLADADAGLPDTYGLEAGDLAALMEAFRSRAERA